MSTISVDNMTNSIGNAVPAPNPPRSSAPHHATKRRSLAKTLSWRVTATTTTFIIAWIVTGDLGAGAAIGGVEAVAKMFLYYGHERAWERVPAT